MSANARTYPIDRLDKPIPAVTFLGNRRTRRQRMWYVYSGSPVGRSSIDGLMKDYQLPGGEAITSGLMGICGTSRAERSTG